MNDVAEGIWDSLPLVTDWILRAMQLLVERLDLIRFANA